jgi:hypothetical protein
VHLRGRRDLARHFCINAATAAVSNEFLSHIIGQLEEQADAGEGGSGFSFADLIGQGILASVMPTIFTSPRHSHQTITPYSKCGVS